jgi:hypothetical protein
MYMISISEDLVGLAFYRAHIEHGWSFKILSIIIKYFMRVKHLENAFDMSSRILVTRFST